MNSDDLKLSRRIQNLVPLPVMLTLALLVLVPAPAGAVDKFVIGDRVQVSIASINVRDAPAGNLIGTQPQGALGTVLAGPVVAGPDNFTYWNFNYDTGTDGWSREDNLKFVEPPPSDKFVIGDRVQVSIASINVRDAPAGNLIGTQPQGALGTVLAGPVVAGPDNFTYWNFNYDTGTDGWSREDNLTKFVPTSPPPPPPPPRADLALSLTDIPDPLTVNGQLTYTMTVRNNGPGAATGLRVVDSLPPGAPLARPADSSQGGCSGEVNVVCDLGTLNGGAQATVTINVIPRVIGGLSNTATVAAFEHDPDPANNSSTGTTMVEPEDPATADLDITAVAELNPRASGQGFTYRLTVKNDGPATATAVQLTNDLPRGIALGPVTASQVTYNCSDTDPMLCSLGALPTGAEATVAIDVIRTEAVTLPNQATVNADQRDPNTANNFALTSALDLPTPQTTCDSKRCRLRLTCNASGLLVCDNQVTLFVETGVRRLSDERATRGPRLVRFAAVIRTFPGGQTENVPLKLTGKGTKLASMLVKQGRKKLRGEIRISNAPGGIDIIPISVRLK